MNLFGIEEEREPTPEELAAAMAVKLNEEAGVTRGDIDAAAMEKLVGPTSFFDANKLSMPTMPTTRGEQEYETNPVAATLKKMLIPKPIYKQMYGQNSQYLGDVARYELDSKLYLEQEKKGLLDKQDEAVAAHIRDVASGKIPADPMELMALKVQANGVSPVNMNNTTLATGARMVDAFGNVVAEGRDPNTLTSQERNLAARNALYARQPDSKKEPGAWAAWDAERRFFEASVRANMNVGNIVRSGVDGEVMGTEDDYIDSAADMTESVTLAESGAEYEANTFQGAADTYRATYEQSGIINERLANVDKAIELFDPENPNRLDTGPIAGGIFKIFGIGQEGMATVENLSIQETMEWLIAFKGPTTDYEFDKSSAAAFANILKGEEVNAEQLQVVRSTLEKVARLNDSKAQAAYGTLQDYLGEPGKPGDRSRDFESINNNYKPWWDQESTSADDGEFMSESDALIWLRNNNSPENREYFQKTYGKVPQ
jgi:hypothetical protein